MRKKKSYLAPNVVNVKLLASHITAVLSRHDISVTLANNSELQTSGN